MNFPLFLLQELTRIVVHQIYLAKIGFPKNWNHSLNLNIFIVNRNKLWAKYELGFDFRFSRAFVDFFHIIFENTKTNSASMNIALASVNHIRVFIQVTLKEILEFLLCSMAFKGYPILVKIGLLGGTRNPTGATFETNSVTKVIFFAAIDPEPSFFPNFFYV